MAIQTPALAQHTKGGKSVNTKCWTTPSGHTACGDRLPASQAGKPYVVVNQRGLIVKRVSGLEAKQEERARKAQKVSQEETVTQARGFLDRYPSLEAISTALASERAVAQENLSMHQDRKKHDVQKLIKVLENAGKQETRKGKVSPLLAKSADKARKQVLSDRATVLAAQQNMQKLKDEELSLTTRWYKAKKIVEENTENQ